MSTPSHRKEIRPSTHRLPNNTTESPEMSTFLGDGASQPLPKAASNYTDPTWSSSQHVDGGDHVRKVLIVSSLVFGVAGVGLLLVASFVFLHRDGGGDTGFRQGGGLRVIKSDGGEVRRWVRRSGAQGCKAWRPSCVAWSGGQDWWSGGQDVGVVPKGVAWGKMVIMGRVHGCFWTANIVVVVAIIGVVIVVTVIGVVVVIVGGVPSIIKLSFVIVGSLHRTML
ncbi:hypothetical protein Tco_1474681 [Tanacetum coccineum]